MSGYKGVVYQHNGWVARINYDGKNKYIGRFKTDIDAASAYNNAALTYHTEYAYINVI